MFKRSQLFYKDQEFYLILTAQELCFIWWPWKRQKSSLEIVRLYLLYIILKFRKNLFVNKIYGNDGYSTIQSEQWYIRKEKKIWIQSSYLLIDSNSRGLYVKALYKISEIQISRRCFNFFKFIIEKHQKLHIKLLWIYELKYEHFRKVFLYNESIFYAKFNVDYKYL